MVEHIKKLFKAEPERRKGTWATPLALACLAAMFGTIGWGGSQVITDIKTDVVDIKSSMTDLKKENLAQHEKLWNAFTEFKKCENQSMVDCCKNTQICYEPRLPRNNV